MKYMKITFLLVIVCMIAIPVFTMNTEQNAVSEIDNRMLTDLTKENSDYTQMIDSYIKDRIGLRTEMISSFTTFNDVLFHEMIHPTYTYGQDGYVFLKYSPENINIEFIDSFCQYLRKAQDYLESRGIPFLYCLNPSKTTVYSQYLSAGYTYENRFNTAMIQSLEKHGVNYIDNVDLLIQKSQEEQVYNIKYDAGHWNDLGCFYGTNHLLSAISSYFPSVIPIAKENFDVGTKLETTLPVSKFIIHEEVPYFTNRQIDQVNYLTDSYFDLQMDVYNRTFSYAVYPDTSLPDILFFHGSYYNGERTKFYQTSFHESVGVHNYQNFLNLDYYVNIFQPDMVLLETAEYATIPYYFSPATLQNKSLNPSYDSVQQLPHQSYSLAELEPVINTNDGSELTTITFMVDPSVEFGYMLTDSWQFDLQIQDGLASLTLKTTDVADAATIKLF